ncbi:MAG: glycerophosphodiester phosphodiesterase [Elusimicrobiota bacterium]
MKAALLSVLLLSAPSLSGARVRVHGHRGCRAVRPENTLAAFDEALRVGADVLELDMVVTKDGVVSVSHNKSIDPAICLGPGGKTAEPVAIHSLTRAELDQYDCGALKNPRFPRQQPRPGEKMPTLEAVFDLVARSTYPAAAAMQFNIETKIVPGEPDLSPEPAEFARLVVGLVKKHHLESRVIVQSFDDRTLREVRKLAPKIRLSLLTSDNHLDYVALAKGLGAEIISPDSQWITADDVARLHKAGVQVAPWTVDDKAGWDRLIAMGVDAIITDDPEALISELKSRP